MSFLQYIPFSYLWIMKRAIGADIHTVLDLGCGDGAFMRAIKQKDWKVTGVELFPESVEKAQVSGVYDKVIKGDVVTLPRQILSKKYDIVISSQVLEHLSKKSGRGAIKRWEAVSTKRTIISTPVGYIDYEPIEDKNENNPLQKHQSGWTIEELSSLGYTVRGQGMKFIYGHHGIARKFPHFLSILSLVGLLVAPLIYYFPHLGMYMIAWKKH